MVKAKKTWAQKVIFTVIILTTIVVVVALALAFKWDNKYLVETEITELAQNYYEEYYYPNVFSGNVSMGEVLGQFEETGLASVSLRQILLAAPKSNEKIMNFLRQYCDENATFVQYFPTQPYDKDSYRIEYTYSCNF